MDVAIGETRQRRLRTPNRDAALGTGSSHRLGRAPTRDDVPYREAYAERNRRCGEGGVDMAVDGRRWVRSLDALAIEPVCVVECLCMYACM